MACKPILLGPTLALALLAAAGCDSNPDGPSSPPASAGDGASPAGAESEVAPPAERRVKVDSGPMSEK